MLNQDGHAGHEIIAMNHSFHGRSIGALSVTGNKHYQEPFEPLLPGVKFADFNDLRQRESSRCYRQNLCHHSGDSTGGRRHLPCRSGAFIKGVEQLCEEHDILLILDEIQCGMGRTGRPVRMAALRRESRILWRVPRHLAVVSRSALSL